MKHLFSLSLCVALLSACVSTPCPGQDPTPAKPQVHHKHHYALGYVRDKGGVVDRNLKGTSYRLGPINPHTDLSVQLHAVYDQGQEGSCVGHGVSEGFSAAYFRQTGKMLDFSRAFPYYLARVLEGSPDQDNGCQIRDAVACAQKQGNCLETADPYVAGDYACKPTAAAYSQAAGYLVLQAFKVDNRDGVSVRQALSQGFLVIFGADLYAEFEDLGPGNYVVPMPTPGEQTMGGHCEIIFGSDDASQLYDVQNSWGTSWGNQGRCKFPYAYIHGADTDDCWVIESVQIVMPNNGDPLTVYPAAKKKFHVKH